MSGARAFDVHSADLLDDWNAGGEPPDVLMGRVMVHPRFAEAVRALSLSAVATIRGRASGAHASVDAGRYVARLAVMWLDVRDELSLPALKRLCAGSGLLSAGRARDYIRILEHDGLIEAVEAGGGNRAARYRVSAQMRANWLNDLRGPISAVSIVAPSAAELLERLDDPAVAATFIETQGRLLLRSAATLPAGEPVVEAFYHPAGGLQILSMLIAGSGDDDAFPSRRPVELAITGLAEATGVSALQLRRVLRRAAASGLVAVHAGPAYALTERADATLRFIYAGQILQLINAIAPTLARHAKA
jgi:hypothetical protein